nr:hypothetical protein BaRGS_019005 [Batillaria attramentaria]
MGFQAAGIQATQVHKSGSTTVANILARYAVAHDLNIALPDRQPGSGRYNYFRSLNRTNVKPVGVGQEYNVLFNHMIYNRKALDLLMPPDTFYCAIMRQPESRFLSAINYYGFLLPQDVRHYMHSIASANTTAIPRSTLNRAPIG